MRNDTRLVYNRLCKDIAELNHVPDATVHFSVEPSVTQKIEQRIQESAEFLQLINIVPVQELTGETIGLDATPHASRTNTSAGERRQPRDVTSMSLDNSYHCQKTDYDTYLKYGKLDAWAHRPEFQTKVRDAIIKSQALARIMVGFNGTHIAKTTDRNKFKMLEDVNKGFPQKYRENAPENVLSDDGSGSGKVQVGLGAPEYKNLDALVYDCVSNLIDPLYQQDDRLRVIVGKDLIDNRHFPLVNNNNTPTEVLAVNTILGMDKIGGVKAITVPYFPANAIMITPLENLSIYYQESGRRRHLRDEPDYDRVTNYESSNDDYVVEQYEAGCFIENIELVE